jgi:hypothetical protein
MSHSKRLGPELPPRFGKAQSAIVDGCAIDYDGKGTIPPRKYFPLFIVTKKNGGWSIAVMHNLCSNLCLREPLSVRPSNSRC